MTESEAEEIMMLMEEYGNAEYAKASALGDYDEILKAQVRAQAAWSKAWFKLKLHIK